MDYVLKTLNILAKCYAFDLVCYLNLLSTLVYLHTACQCLSPLGKKYLKLKIS